MKWHVRTLLAVGLGLLGLILVSCGETPQEPGQAFDAEGPELAATEFDDDVIQSVTGNAHMIDPAGDRTVTFNILKHADGSVDGWYHALTRGPGGAHVRVRMECLHVDGNQAWAKGTIVVAANPNNIGRPVSVRFIDNGEGAGAPPDEFGGIWLDFDCTSEPDLSTRQVTIGNLSIRG